MSTPTLNANNVTPVNTDQPFLVPIERLRFDRANPRFVDFEGQSDIDIVKFLYEEADLNELVQSISASGFINFEPLIVLQNGGDYIVLEGNRRLGAVVLLRSAQIQEEMNLSLSALDPEKLRSTNHLLVREVTSRSEARAFIGFKHINGPHKWDSLAKAKYAAEWLSDGGTIQDIARTLGDTHNTVRRLVFGWLVLKQAESNGFDKEQRVARRFSFSHLYTALSRPGFRDYIGISDDPGEAALIKNPVSAEHLDELRQMMTWLYGDKNSRSPAVIQSQNPDLNRLNEVLQHNEARRYFLSRQNLAEAYAIIAPKSRRFADALIEATRSAKEALSFVPEYDRDPSLIDSARSLARTAQALVKLMDDAISEGESVSS